MTTTNTPAHSANIATEVAADWTDLYVAWCPCGWTATETHRDEDAAQADAADHVAAPHGWATDPFNPDAKPVALAAPLPPMTESARHAWGAEGCTCGYDLCGVCGAERAAGNRPPLQRTPLLGAGNAEPLPTAWDLFHRSQRVALRNR